MTFVLPKDFIVDFLHTNLEDPRGRLTNNSETFSAGATSYDLTATSGKVISITSLTIGGVAQTKWTDYKFDYQNEKIIFPSATSGEVIVNYKQGTAWIYPDKPLVSLSDTSFPRINILDSGGTDSRLGQYNAPKEDKNAYQIDVWVKKAFIYTKDDHKYSNNALADYITLKAKKVFDNFEGQLIPTFYNASTLTTPQDLGYDEEFQCFHKIFIVELSSIDIGETKW